MSLQHVLNQAFLLHTVTFECTDGDIKLLLLRQMFDLQCKKIGLRNKYIVFISIYSSIWANVAETGIRIRD